MDMAVCKDCLAMAERTLVENQSVSKSIREEQLVIEKAFKYFDRIPLEGIAIYIVDNNESALDSFSVYSRLNRDVYTIHFGEVNYSYPGAAQIINWETAKVLKDKCSYVNREQDLGIPGLRQTKLSYEPELIYPSIFLSFKG